jgi:hypothetical protein
MIQEVFGNHVELKRNPLTSDFAITSDLPTDMKSGNESANWEGKDPN